VTVKIGIVGVGFMGMIHYLAAQRLRGVKVAAICSRDAKKRAGDWRGIQGNFGPAGEKMDLGSITRYSSLDELLDDPEIDLVDICTPPSNHGKAVIATLKAGKHVLVEKPICLEAREADAMMRAAKQNGKLLMVAQVLPFIPEFDFAAQAVRSGKYGKLQAAHFKRVISQPDWSSEVANATQNGGPAIDLHIHDTHFIGLIAGIPRKVFSVGVVTRKIVQYLTTSYIYGRGGPAISASSGALNQKGRPFCHGFEIFLEDATLIFDSEGGGLRLLDKKGKLETPKLKGSGDPLAAFQAELHMAAEAVATGEEPAYLSGQLARDALVLCHQECQSVVSGKAVTVSRS
jgi:predicted dehydrogenase